VILESITDAFFALDDEWRFTYLNREAERVLLRSREDLLGKNVWDEFGPGVGSTFQTEYTRARREGVTVKFEEYYPPLGAWLEVSAYPRPDGLAVFFQDVGDRKRSEAALLESEDRFITVWGGCIYLVRFSRRAIEAAETTCSSKVQRRA
jgi:PAS domain S-box-containing protein